MKKNGFLFKVKSNSRASEPSDSLVHIHLDAEGIGIWETRKFRCLEGGDIASATPVNINSATAEQIAEALSGIGISKAQAIVNYREAYGLFNSADEIVFVRGIGGSTFESNKDDILVK